MFLVSCLTIAVLLILMKPEKSFKHIVKKIKSAKTVKFFVK